MHEFFSTTSREIITIRVILILSLEWKDAHSTERATQFMTVTILQQLITKWMLTVLFDRHNWN